MGGRSATSGVATFGRKSGTRLTAKQYKDAISDQANFILRDIKPRVPNQVIIRKSFVGNVARVELVTGDGLKLTAESEGELRSLQSFLSGRLRYEEGQKVSSPTWSGYGMARARAELYNNMLKDIKKLLKN